MLLVDDLAAGGTKNLRHTPRGLVTLATTGALKCNHQLVVATTGAFTLTSVMM